MNGSKPWYESTGIWGSIITGVSVLAGFFGHSISADVQSQLVNNLVDVGTGIAALVGAVVALVGRVSAKQTIGAPPAAATKAD